jgi:hypothetical protein
MRVSCTVLEAFRRWSDPEQQWMSEADLLASIRGEFKPTYETLVGQGFGRVLERPDRYRVNRGYEYRAGSLLLFFSDDMMAPALALMDRRAVYEAKATKDYGDITVVSKADQILGSALVEHKTTFGTFDFEKYASSYQWRLMVDMFQPAWVTYHVFLLKHAPEGLSLRGVESFNLYPYPALHDDCADLVRRFGEYATLRDLAPVLVRTQTEYPTLV